MRDPHVSEGEQPPVSLLGALARQFPLQCGDRRLPGDDGLERHPRARGQIEHEVVVGLSERFGVVPFAAAEEDAGHPAPHTHGDGDRGGRQPVPHDRCEVRGQQRAVCPHLLWGEPGPEERLSGLGDSSRDAFADPEPAFRDGRREPRDEAVGGLGGRDPQLTTLGDLVGDHAAVDRPEHVAHERLVDGGRGVRRRYLGEEGAHDARPLHVAPQAALQCSLGQEQGRLRGERLEGAQVVRAQRGPTLWIDPVDHERTDDLLADAQGDPRLSVRRV